MEGGQPLDYGGMSDFGESDDASQQNSVNGGGNLSSAGEEEANDILRGVFGDEYVTNEQINLAEDNESARHRQQQQPQHAMQQTVVQQEGAEHSRGVGAEQNNFVEQQRNFETQHQQHIYQSQKQGFKNSTVPMAIATATASVYNQNGVENANQTIQQQEEQHPQDNPSYYPRAYAPQPSDSATTNHQQPIQPPNQMALAHYHQQQEHQKQLQAQMMAQQQIQNEGIRHQQNGQPIMSTPVQQQHNRQFAHVPSRNPSRNIDAVIGMLHHSNSGASASISSVPSKRQRLDSNFRQGLPENHPAAASYAARNHHMPGWMNGVATQHQHIQPVQHRAAAPPKSAPTTYASRIPLYGQPVAPRSRQYKPIMREIPKGHVPTWNLPLPHAVYRMATGPRRFELSLVNVKEFTITGLPTGYDRPPSSLDGLRKKIKELSKEHGKAVYERGKDGEPGRWRIPLGAYSSFYAYLNNDPSIQVKGIPQDQLKIASLGKARLDKGYPSVKKLINTGVPKGLANALAPFQRGGVDFVVEKKGRALIADEMGLGKTVQAIASMSVYHRDWPLLVLSPSSARYHWENEFQQWLGRDSRVNNEKQSRVNLGGESDGEEEDEDEVVDEKNCMTLLCDSQIHVLTSGKDDILPRSDTMVVICSYGLAPALAASGKMYPGLFRSAIVDESHMLKNLNTKRTKNLVPVLSATNRCVLLSGTPALAKPSELWPQLKILNTANSGWWEEEESFYEKYVKNSSAVRRAELHAMLTGTVMIRRLKNDILKSLPKKSRGRAIVDVTTPEMKSEFYRCMKILREGKGQLGKLAKEHSVLGPAPPEPTGPTAASVVFEKAKAAIQAEQHSKYEDRVRQIDYALATSGTTLDANERDRFRQQSLEALQRELQVWYRERIHELQEEIPQENEQELSKKSVLNRMYTLTGKAKIPLVSTMIKRWLNDQTKGKLCVFAHHIFVLDELVRLGELSNQPGSKSMYIRIDGSTSPKERQAQIKKFQNDPNVRIAILGITAAGVAVTLTASSTVWFTELFWTPALMIQAEDRCHRIGQNSRVQCLYFVGSGTLDDLLWKLLEKKFRDLGEFVEGQEKQKIVVHKTYHGTKDLDAMFNIPEDDEEAELNFDHDSDEEMEGTEILNLENDLQSDIELLGREELTMMKVDGEDDDGAEEIVLERTRSEPTPGSTEEEAILLSDDEDDAKNDTKKPASQTKETDREGSEATVVKEVAPPNAVSPEADIDSAEKVTPAGFDTRRPLVGCRAYSVIFEGASYGMKLFIFQGRVLVGHILNKQHDLPSQYAVVVGVNGRPLPMLNDLSQIMTYMKASLERGAVEVLFLESPALKEECKRLQAERLRIRREAEAAKTKEKAAPSTGTTDVIELLDDD